MKKCVVVCLLMVAFYVIPYPPRRPINPVPYCWFPGYESEMQQLYAGEYLVWTPYQIRNIGGYILITSDTVRFGACSYFLSIRHLDEWFIAGWVRLYSGEVHYFIMYQTVSNGYACIIFEVTPIVGDWIWVNINHLGGNKWRAIMPKIRFNITVEFETYPDEFCALGKSLDSCNKLRSTFTNLMWWSSESSFNYWGNSFFGTPSEVDIRSDYPYEVKVHEEYYCFSIGLLEAIRKRGRGSFFAGHCIY